MTQRKAAAVAEAEPERRIERLRIRVEIELDVAAVAERRDQIEAHYRRLLLQPPPAAYAVAESVRVEPT